MKIKIANTLPWPDNYPDGQMCIEHFRAHIRWKERSISLSSTYLMLGYGQLSPTQMFVVYVRVHELPTYGKDKNVYHLPKHFLYVMKRVTHANILVASLMALHKSATCARTKGVII